MGMVRQHQCRAHRWSSPPLDHQTVEFGAKGRTGPSPRMAGHVRWAGAGLGEGGDALHTDPVLAGQVLVIWGGVEGKVVEEGKLVGRGRAYRPHGDFIAGAVASAGGRWCTWWGVGTAEEGGQGKVVKEGVEEVRPPPPQCTTLTERDRTSSCSLPGVGVTGPLWLCGALLSAPVPAVRRALAVTGRRRGRPNVSMAGRDHALFISQRANK